ncbi:DUF3800 domain-containing protein [Amycolatopsis sp. cmx-11-51]|uniref:DUF3800 domain-containing protein n=1 Tax=Amycolatopsis sp. cmx-11-51 TaxID=2785797 RepID=UPI0039E4FA93
MTDLYLFLDETGDLTLSGQAYFGLGQATFEGDMGPMAWEGTRLRFELESQGVKLPKGFHANEDPELVRQRVVDLIARHKPRIDVTLLRKRSLPAEERASVAADEAHLYYLAWRKHFLYQAKYVLRKYHRIFVVAASISEHKHKQEAATAAIEKVLERYPHLNITLCIWDNPTSWGLQVADYGLWVVQRDLRQGYCKHFAALAPLIESVYSPWEKNGARKEYKPAAECRKRNRVISTLVFDRYNGPPTATPDIGATSTAEASLEWGDDETEREHEEWKDGDHKIDDPWGQGLWGNAIWSDDDGLNGLNGSKG